MFSGLISIVRPAAQLQVLHRRLTAFGKRLHVVILEKPALATATVGDGERAAPAVARPDRALHRRRNVSRLGN